MGRIKRINRRELIKGGAGGALAMGVLAAGASPASADEGRRGGGIAVHIHGVVHTSDTVPFFLVISMEVAGRRDDLAGGGWDSGLGTEPPAGMVPGRGPTATSGPVGACYYTAAGKLEGHLVTLRGRSLFTNRPLTDGSEEAGTKSDTRADGRTLHATANVKTGFIKFALTTSDVPPAVFPLTGTGTVIVFRGGRASGDDD